MFRYEFICVKNNRHIFICCFLFLWSFACTEYPEYPVVPQVSFVWAHTNITETDKHIAFNFLLKDGDGDMGLGSADTSNPFVDSLQYNFHASIFVTKNNTTQKLPYGLQYRIPQIRSTDSKKFIKAEVTIDIDFARSLFPYDTLQLVYYVYDRALHKSNIDTSNIIVIRN